MTAEKKKITFAMHPEIKDLNDEQRKLYEKIRDLYRSHCLEEAIKRYQIGQLVWLARSDRNRYGEQVLAKISAALGISWQTLYRWSNVAGCFGPEAFAELMKKRTKHGNRLTWTHVEMLTHVGDAADINRLIDAVLKKDLSAADLFQLINASLPEPPSKPPTIRVPRSPVGGLRALSRQAAGIKEQCGVFDQGVTDKLLAQESEDVQPEVLEELRTCEAELESMIEAATEKLESVRECIRMLQSDLADAEQASAARTRARSVIGRTRVPLACAA